jgi:hypothetical protein
MGSIMSLTLPSERAGGYLRRMLRGLVLLGLISGTAFTVPRPALSAPQPVLLGSFQSWDAYAAGDGLKKSCYVLSSPVRQDRPGAIMRDAAYFLIRWPGEPSLIEGALFQRGSAVKLLIDEQRFTMFTDADGAWVRDPADEKRLVAAMKGGANMVIQGQLGPDGVAAVDHYSLRGLSAALTKVEQACR